jgi:hypothetical protein
VKTIAIDAETARPANGLDGHQCEDRGIDKKAAKADYAEREVILAV